MRTTTTPTIIKSECFLWHLRNHWARHEEGRRVSFNGDAVFRYYNPPCSCGSSVDPKHANVLTLCIELMVSYWQEQKHVKPHMELEPSTVASRRSTPRTACEIRILHATMHSTSESTGATQKGRFGEPHAGNSTPSCIRAIIENALGL